MFCLVQYIPCVILADSLAAQQYDPGEASRNIVPLLQLAATLLHSAYNCYHGLDSVTGHILATFYPTTPRQFMGRAMDAIDFTMTYVVLSNEQTPPRSNASATNRSNLSSTPLLM